MGGVAGALVGLAAWLGGLAAPPTVDPGRFRGWLEAGLRGDLEVSGAAARRAVAFRYVFVGGFAAEAMPGYFAQNIRELQALGVPPAVVHAVFPSSHRGDDENVAALAAELRRLAGLGPERLVIIAHSRGASEALAAALADPGLVAARVAALFLLQGAFGGTPLADRVLGRGEAMDRRMPGAARLVGATLIRAERMAMRRGLHGGLIDLARDVAREGWSRALSARPAAASVVGPKVFYIRSQAHPSRLRLTTRAAGWYLHTYYGPNDGVVALEDQSVPGLGTVLGTFDLVHGDLTNQFPISRGPRRYRRALVRAVVLALAGGEPVVAAR